MALLVDWSTTLVQTCNILTTVEYIAEAFRTDMNGSQLMYPIHFGSSLTFHVVPSLVDANVSTEWFALKSGTDIQGPQMNCNHFSSSLTSSLTFLVQRNVNIPLNEFP